MAEETKTALKLEKETQTVAELVEKLQEVIKHEFDGGIEHINTHEMGEAIDMLKDATEAKKNIVEACYKKQIMEAMEESEYGEDYDETGEIRYYRGQPRSKTTGRYMSRSDGRRRSYEESWHMPEVYMMHPPEYYRDMDRGNGRMYYPDGQDGMNRSGRISGNMSSDMSGNRSYSDGRSYYDDRRTESRYDRSRRNYEESKEMHKGNTPEDTQENVRNLESLMSVLEEDLNDALLKMTQAEKTMMKNKLASWSNKI